MIALEEKKLASFHLEPLRSPIRVYTSQFRPVDTLLCSAYLIVVYQVTAAPVFY